MQKSSFIDFKYLKGRPCSFPFVYEGLVGSPSGNMSRKDNLILLAQSFYLILVINIMIMLTWHLIKARVLSMPMWHSHRKQKHCKNSKCCPLSLLIEGSLWLFGLLFLIVKTVNCHFSQGVTACNKLQGSQLSWIARWEGVLLMLSYQPANLLVHCCTCLSVIWELRQRTWLLVSRPLIMGDY